MRISFVLLLVQTFKLIGGELFSSNAHLQRAIYAEKDIADLLHAYLEQEEARLQQIKQ